MSMPSGFHHSEETKKKISEALKGMSKGYKSHPQSEETKIKLSENHKGNKNPMFGKHCSGETTRKMSESQKGHPGYMRGRNHSEETKRKMSESHKGKIFTEEHLNNMSKVRKGRPTGYHHKEETKRLMSERMGGAKNPSWKGGISAHYKPTPEHNRILKQRRRIKFIQSLGGRCVKCGFLDWRALQVDHVNGGGRKEFAELKGSIGAFYKRIKNNPENYQLLCANCNWIKRYENNEAVPRRINP